MEQVDIWRHGVHCVVMRGCERRHGSQREVFGSALNSVTPAEPQALGSRFHPLQVKQLAG